MAPFMHEVTLTMVAPSQARQQPLLQQEVEWLRRHEDGGKEDDEVLLGKEGEDEGPVVDIEDEEILRLKLEEQARVKRKEERDRLKAEEENKASSG